MTPKLINRKLLKADMKALLADAQVCPKRMTALYCILTLAVHLAVSFAPAEGIIGTFFSILSTLLSTVLGAGFVLYCMAVRRNERAEYLTLFDGFSFAGKLIAVSLLTSAFIALWSMLFVIPGIIAAYRYRFALYNLYDNPDIGVMQALDMSKKQTEGYKGQLFSLDLSYLGWEMLATIPSFVQSTLISIEMTSSMMSGSVQLPTDLSAYSAIPGWGWLLISGIWVLAVSIFYLPVKTCTNLGYFEIAKETSGIRADSDEQANSSNGNSNDF